MTADQRREALLRSNAWLDTGTCAKAAWDWHGLHAARIGAIKASQWEGLLRIGCAAQTLDQYVEEMKKRLIREPKSESASPKYRLGDKAFTESLMNEVKKVALEETERRAAFDTEAGRLPEERIAELKEWWKMAMARGFLSALVQRIRARDVVEEVRKWQPQLV
jgi:hypothetical protein